jgi:DivIVA domain-containing protein
MSTVLLVLVVVLVVAALVFGVASMLNGDDPGLSAVDPDGRALPLPNNRSLAESDIKTVRFDVTVRGYRMSQVDRVLRRTAYDVGYKDEMIAVLEAEVSALREGRVEDADLLRKAREAAANPVPAPVQTLGAGGLSAADESPIDETVTGEPAADQSAAEEDLEGLTVADDGPLAPADQQHQGPDADPDSDPDPDADDSGADGGAHEEPAGAERARG